MQIILVYGHAKKFCLMEGKHFFLLWKDQFCKFIQNCRFINMSYLRSPLEPIVMCSSINGLTIFDVSILYLCESHDFIFF